MYRGGVLEQVRGRLVHSLQSDFIPQIEEILSPIHGIEIKDWVHRICCSSKDNNKRFKPLFLSIPGKNKLLRLPYLLPMVARKFINKGGVIKNAIKDEIAKVNTDEGVALVDHTPDKSELKRQKIEAQSTVKKLSDELAERVSKMRS